MVFIIAKKDYFLYTYNDEEMILMLKEFKNISVNYEADAIVEISGKKYKIHDVVEGEDILVETEGKYPALAKVLKPSEHRINNGCPHQKE